MWAIVIKFILLVVFSFLSALTVAPFLQETEIYISNIFNQNIPESTFVFSSAFIVFILVVWMTGILSIIYAQNSIKNNREFFYFVFLMLFFLIFMTILILSNSLIMFFLGWEGTGLISFLLISFWSNRAQAALAAIKAVLINRFGDILLLIALAQLHTNLHIQTFIQLLLADASITNTVGFKLVIFFIILSALIKSAQFPMITWLVSAMEGPTPVSALMHAATLVTAGTILLIKISPFISAPAPLIIVVSILTAIYCSVRALIEYDFKVVTALSTAAQMSVVFLLVVVNRGGLAISYLVVHAVFKSLLFWAVGLYNHENKTQYFLGHRLTNRILFFIILLATCALLGTPFLAAFYLKELIIFIPSLCMAVVTVIVVSILIVEILSTIYATAILLKVSKIKFIKNGSTTSLLLIYSIFAIIVGRFADPVIKRGFSEVGTYSLDIVSIYIYNNVINYILYLVTALLLILTTYKFIRCVIGVAVNVVVVVLNTFLVLFINICLQLLCLLVDMISVGLAATLLIQNLYCSVYSYIDNSVKIRKPKSKRLQKLAIEFKVWLATALYHIALTGFLIQVIPETNRWVFFSIYLLMLLYGICGSEVDEEKSYLAFLLIPIVLFMLVFIFTAEHWYAASIVLYAILFSV